MKNVIRIEQLRRGTWRVRVWLEDNSFDRPPDLRYNAFTRRGALKMGRKFVERARKEQETILATREIFHA